MCATLSDYLGTILLTKSKEKRLLGRSTCRQEHNMKGTHRTEGWDVVGWIRLIQDGDWGRALVNTVLNHKNLGIYRISEQLSAPKNELCLVYLVSLFNERGPVCDIQQE